MRRQRRRLRVAPSVEGAWRYDGLRLGAVFVDDGEKLHLATYCGHEALAAGLKAGDLLRDLAALAGGKGGGKPDQARGAAPQRDKLSDLKSAAVEMLNA